MADGAAEFQTLPRWGLNWTVAFIVGLNQFEEQLFDVRLVVAFGKFVEGAHGEDLSSMNDGDPVAKLLDLAHDVRREDDAFALRP